MTSTQFAIKQFTRTCLREARRCDFIGDKRMAANLRRAVSDTIAEHRAALPPAPVDAETAKRQERARVFAATILSGFNPGLMAHKPETMN